MFKRRTLTWPTTVKLKLSRLYYFLGYISMKQADLNQICNNLNCAQWSRCIQGVLKRIPFQGYEGVSNFSRAAPSSYSSFLLQAMLSPHKIRSKSHFSALVGTTVGFANSFMPEVAETMLPIPCFI